MENDGVRQATSISVGTARSLSGDRNMIQLRLHQGDGAIFALSTLAEPSAVALAEGILAAARQLQAAAADCAGSA